MLVKASTLKIFKAEGSMFNSSKNIFSFVVLDMRVSYFKAIGN